MNNILLIILLFISLYIFISVLDNDIIEGNDNKKNNKIQSIYGKSRKISPLYKISKFPEKKNLPTISISQNKDLVEGMNLWIDNNIDNLDIHNQNHICWSVVICQVIKGQYFLDTGINFDPSVQQLLDCVNAIFPSITDVNVRNLFDHDIIKIIYEIFIKHRKRIYSVEDYPVTNRPGYEYGDASNCRDIKNPSNPNIIYIPENGISILGQNDQDISMALNNNKIIIAHIYYETDDNDRLLGPISQIRDNMDENAEELFIDIQGDDDPTFLWNPHQDNNGNWLCVHDLNGVYCDSLLENQSTYKNWNGVNKCDGNELSEDLYNNIGINTPYCIKLTNDYPWQKRINVNNKEECENNTDTEWINEELSRKISPWESHSFCSYECQNTDRRNLKRCAQSVHVVLIVGERKYNNKHYWIVKNNWGNNWGYNGNFYVQKTTSYNKNYNGKASLLGITNYNCVITLESESPQNSQNPQNPQNPEESNECLCKSEGGGDNAFNPSCEELMSNSAVISNGGCNIDISLLNPDLTGRLCEYCCDTCS